MDTLDAVRRIDRQIEPSCERRTVQPRVNTFVATRELHAWQTEMQLFHFPSVIFVTSPFYALSVHHLPVRGRILIFVVNILFVVRKTVTQ
jgi:hypothetical protein